LHTDEYRHRVAGHDEKNNTRNGDVQIQTQRVKGDTERGALIHTYTMTITQSVICMRDDHISAHPGTPLKREMCVCSVS
jgi:hypothetical protein